MQQTATVQTTTIPARPMAAVKAESRLAYIDIIRMILIIMVIMVHAAVTYGATGDWTYEDQTLAPDTMTEVLLSLFNIVSQSFFMGLFFFYSGVFTPGAYDRKGIARYWKDRLMRLAIPMLIYTYFLSRIPNYIREADYGGMTLSFWDFARLSWWSQADSGPTWFLFALLLFSLGYTLWRIFSSALRLDLSWTTRLPAPGTKALLALALILGAAQFAIAQVVPFNHDIRAFGTYSMLVGYFPSYILLFTFGILAARNQWLARIPGKLLRFWAPLSIALILALPAFLILSGAIDSGLDPYVSGWDWRCAVTCVWNGLACVAFSTTLSLWMRERIQPSSKIAALAGPSTFTVYLIHPLVLVPITYALTFIALPAMPKFALAVIFTVAICYPLAAALRRIPGAKAVL